MNSQGSAAGWQPNLPSFLCPFAGCGRIENSTELLRYVYLNSFDKTIELIIIISSYHVDHAHLYSSQPQQRFHQASRGEQLSRYASPYPLRNTSFVTSANAPVSPTTALFQQLAHTHSNLPSAAVTNNSQRPAPTHSSMAPPTVQTQNFAMNPAAQHLTDEQALSEVRT